MRWLRIKMRWTCGLPCAFRMYMRSECHHRRGPELDGPADLDRGHRGDCPADPPEKQEAAGAQRAAHAAAERRAGSGAERVNSEPGPVLMDWPRPLISLAVRRSLPSLRFLHHRSPPVPAAVLHAATGGTRLRSGHSPGRPAAARDRSRRPPPRRRR